ncbi:MAG: hypothetical protein KKA65_06370 [Nanoarchaeota archaeon]|nr:hypothetical protein [Nanoarchaeota archaeon]
METKAKLENALKEAMRAVRAALSILERTQQAFSHIESRSQRLQFASA